MFPLFPALILLLLQGPSNFERAAMEGRLPTALEAISCQSAQLGSPRLSEQEEQALAELIASGTEISQALLTILCRTETPRRQEPVLETRPTPPFVLPDAPPISSGFANTQRSRDGPVTLDAVR